jgi:hypothetical protein
MSTGTLLRALAVLSVTISAACSHHAHHSPPASVRLQAGTCPAGPVPEDPYADAGEPGEPAAMANAQWCGPGKSCSFECDEGGCAFACAEGSSCDIQCDGGNCQLSCGDGATCNLQCDGGRCGTACGAGTTCNLQCDGGSCAHACAPDASCNAECDGGNCA